MNYGTRLESHISLQTMSSKDIASILLRNMAVDLPHIYLSLGSWSYGFHLCFSLLCVCSSQVTQFSSFYLTFLTNQRRTRSSTLHSSSYDIFRAPCGFELCLEHLSLHASDPHVHHSDVLVYQCHLVHSLVHPQLRPHATMDHLVRRTLQLLSSWPLCHRLHTEGSSDKLLCFVVDGPGLKCCFHHLLRIWKGCRWRVQILFPVVPYTHSSPDSVRRKF